MAITVTPRLPVGSLADHAVLAMPVLLWVLAVAVVNPIGNFPLNDDWSFSLAVRHLLETGEFRPLGWTSMTLLGETLWGALFCLPFGFSFNALRLATLVAGAFGLVAFSLLLQVLGCDRRKTAFATLLLGFNPVYFVLSSSFMTDVGFTALSVCSVLFFFRYLVERLTGNLLWAIAFALAALTVRQLALFLPIAMLGVLVLERNRDRRALVLALCTLLASAAFLAGYDAWLSARDAIPALYRLPPEALFRQLTSPLKLIATLQQNLRGAVAYIGWFAFPLLIWRLPTVLRDYLRTPGRKAVLIVSGVGGIAWFVLMVALHHMMPVATNTVNVSGLGPVILHDSEFKDNLPSLPVGFWILITFLSVSGGILLLLNLGLTTMSIVATHRARQIDTATNVRTFLLIGTCSYLAPLMATSYFDRYLLPAVFMMIVLVTFEARIEGAVPRRPQHTRLIRAISVFTLVLTCAFAVAGTHDYLSWNRARWRLLDRLEAEGVAPERIDGGVEFNGLYMYDPHYVVPPSKSYWWVHDDEYIVQFTPLAGYRIVGSADAGGWLPSLRTKLLVLKRDRH